MIDPSLPRFEEVWEPDRVVDLLNDVLEVEPGWEVGGLTLDRIRHRPGVRGIVQYRGHLGNGSDLREFWVAGSIHSDGRSADQALKLSRHAPAAGPGVRSLVAYDSLLGMLWQVFPLDRRLPDLQRVYSDPGLLGASSLRPVRHRLGLSATVEAEVGGERKFVKFHRRGDSIPAVARGHALAQRCRMGFVLPEAVDGVEATFTSGVNGISLDRHPAIIEVVGVLAGRLAEIHALSPIGLDDVVDTPARRACRAAEWLRVVMPEMGPLIERATDREWPEGGGQLVHGDLKPDHVFFSEGEIQMIDVDSVGRGRGLADVAQLFVRLADREAADSFRDDYFALAMDRSEWSGELAMASLQFALFHAQHRPPDWRLMVEAILERASRN